MGSEMCIRDRFEGWEMFWPLQCSMRPLKRMFLALGVGGARLEGWPPPFPDATAVRGESKNITHLDATVGDGDQGIQRVQ